MGCGPASAFFILSGEEETHSGVSEAGAHHSMVVSSLSPALAAAICLSQSYSLPI